MNQRRLTLLVLASLSLLIKACGGPAPSAVDNMRSLVTSDLNAGNINNAQLCNKVGALWRPAYTGTLGQWQGSCSDKDYFERFVCNKLREQNTDGRKSYRVSISDGTCVESIGGVRGTKPQSVASGEGNQSTIIAEIL